MTSTLDAALLCSSRVGSDLGHESGLVFRSVVNSVSSDLDHSATMAGSGNGSFLNKSF